MLVVWREKNECLSMSVKVCEFYKNMYSACCAKACFVQFTQLLQTLTHTHTFTVIYHYLHTQTHNLIHKQIVFVISVFKFFLIRTDKYKKNSHKYIDTRIPKPNHKTTTSTIFYKKSCIGHSETN